MVLSCHASEQSAGEIAEHVFRSQQLPVLERNLLDLLVETMSERILRGGVHGVWSVLCVAFLLGFLDHQAMPKSAWRMLVAARFVIGLSSLMLKGCQSQASVFSNTQKLHGAGSLGSTVEGVRLACGYRGTVENGLNVITVVDDFLGE